MVLRDRHKRTLDLIESHSCELLRLLAEAKQLDEMSKSLFEASQAILPTEEDPPDTIPEEPYPF